MIQWFRIHSSTAEAAGLSPGLGTEILYAVWCIKKKLQK